MYHPCSNEKFRMMIINLATAAVTAVLALSSGQNMVQTAQLSRKDAKQGVSDKASLVEKLSIQPNDSTDNIVKRVRSMKRKDLLELYFSSQAPKDLTEIQGEWDGKLLDNNSLVMTSVTAFITDRLFGKGKRWNGKKFGADNNQNVGRNRFHPSTSAAKQSSNHNSQITGMERHSFDLSIRPSKLGANEPSLILDYTAYQSPLSLWRTMMDEIRIVPLEGDTRVLIGLGYMAWSGGRLNSSPFVLYHKKSSVGGSAAADGFSKMEL